MKVVILCGGYGARLREETEFRPKPMIEVGGRPLLWHIMKIYAWHGFTEFILCLGNKGRMIKEYFLNYEAMNNDLTVTLGSPSQLQLHNDYSEKGWTVTLVDTGELTMTGGRVKRVEKYIDTDAFMLTYGDGVADINIRRLVEFHFKNGKIGTVAGVRPPSRFGELITDHNRVVEFAEKPFASQGWINGGFFVFSKAFFEYLDDGDNCVLEGRPLERLARNGELMVFPHDGFWQCMDTYRDMRVLQSQWESGKAPWAIWND